MKKRKNLLLCLCLALAFSGTAATLASCGGGGENSSSISTPVGDSSSSSEEEVVEYTVSFSVDGAVDSALTQTVSSGALAEKPENPVKEGYVFAGWYVDSAFKKAFAFAATPITADVTIYARFVEAVASDADVTVKFVVDGVLLEETVRTIGGVAYGLPEPQKENATFAGWWVSDYDDAEKLTYKYTDQKLVQNTTFYAVWESAAPQVSVSAEGVTWSAKGVNNQYDVTITAPDGSKVVDGEKTAQTSYSYDFSAAAAGEYVIEIALNDQATKVYYKNKALAKVSTFKVVDSILIFNAVENATKYYITVDCGDDDHTHTEVDLGTETAYDFSNCAMQKGGIKFVVKAVAEGYMESVSEEYAYSKDLAAVNGLAASADGQQITWTAVENATSYKVEIIVDGKVETATVTETSCSIKYYSGEMTVKVTPIAAGYNSPDAAEFTYVKTTLATPANVRLDGNKVAWDAVAGASKYIVKINNKEFESTTNEFVLTSEALGTEEVYTVSIKAVGTAAGSDSTYSDGITIRFSTMADTLTYKNGEVSWEPVLNTSGFGVQINDEEEVMVDANVTKAAITFTKAGSNTVKVRCYSDIGNPSNWVVIEVYAYEVSFDAAGGDAIANQYKAQGDTIAMPSAERLGYNFLGWYNTPNGIDGAKYEDEIVQGEEDVEIYAHWASQQFAVTFSLEDGCSVDQENVEVYYEQKYQLPVAKTQDAAKAFAGWYTEPDGAGLCYTDSTGASMGVWNDLRDRTLYARWVEIFTFNEINNGAAYSVSQGSGISIVTSVTIPSEYNGKPVTTVEADAFKSCTKLVEVNIPDTIQNVNIGIMGQYGAGSAFSSCNKLQNINIYAVEGNHERFYESQNGVLYKIAHDENGVVTERELIMYPYARKDAVAVIHEGATSIAAGAFRSAKFTEITIPYTVTNIGAQAFSSSKLVTITFTGTPNGEEEKVLTIGEKAFQSCSDLENITLPARLADFDINIFASCSGLKYVNITGIGGQYSSNDGILCSADGATIVYCPIGREGVYKIPEGVLHVAEKAFSGCKNLTEIIIPNYVQTIGKEAFKECKGLKKITFEGQADDSPLTIGEGAFYTCTNTTDEIGLTEITLPANLVSLGANAFGNNKYLTKVTLNTNENATLAVNAFGTTAASPVFYVTDLYLGENVVAFDIAGVCGDKLENVVVADNNDYIESKDGVLFGEDFTEILYYPTARQGDYEIPETVKVIGARVFKNKLGLTQITIPNTVTDIGEEAFAGCTKITVLEFKEGGTEALKIGKKAFYNTSLETLALPGRLTEIGESAFYGVDITELVIPEGVKTIGINAFQSCSSLASVSLPESLETLVETSVTSSGVNYAKITAFNNCNKLTEIIVNENNKTYAANQGIIYKKSDAGITELCFVSRGATGEIVIPNTVTKIWYQAFYYNENITSVTFSGALPEGNELEIQNEAFWWCKALNYVGLPKGLKTIPTSLFEYCSKLEEVYIPNTVTLIEDQAFSGCTALTTVTFEKGGTEGLEFADGTAGSDGFYYSIFSGCANLKTLEFPERTTKIGQYMFAAGANQYGSKQTVSAIESIYIPAGVETLGSYMFYQAENLKSVTFGDGINLTEIPERMFYRTKLTSITIPESVEVIGSNAFYYVETLLNVTIPAGVKTIGDSAFGYNKSLTSVTFAEGSQLTSIGASAFLEDSKLTSVTIPAGVESIGNYAFAGCDVLSSVTFALDAEGKSNLNTMGNYAFGSSSYGGAAFTQFEFPETYETFELGSNMFYGCKKLESVHLSSTVSKIDDAFLGCPSLTQLTVAPGNGHFALHATLPIVMNLELTAIRFIYGDISGEFIVPEGVEEIDANAFENQTGLTKVVLPQTLKVLSTKAFLNCTSLEEVEFAKDIALTTVGDNVFENCSALTSIDLPTGVTSVGTYLFKNCTSLAEVTIPEGYTALSNYMFNGCTALKSITLPSTLTALGQYTFKAAGLESIVLPAGYQVAKVSTDIYAFQDCKSLQSAILPASLDIIPNQFFNGCTSLATIKLIDETGNIIGNDNEVVLPTTLKEIGSGSFKNCALITNLSIPETVEKFGSNCFEGCNGITEITIPGSVLTFAGSMFLNCTSLQTVVFDDALTDLSKATSMFKGCTALSDVTLPAGATKLANAMFEGCTSLKGIELPNSITFLGYHTFAFSGLIEVTIPTGVTQLAFKEGLADNKHVTTSTTAPITSSGTYQTSTNYNMAAVFGSCLNLERVILHEGVKVIGNATFHNCPKLTEIGDASGVVVLGSQAFAGCSSLTSVSLPSYVGKSGSSSIGAYKAFADCTSLTTLEMPKLTTMGNYMFQNCTSLTSMDLSGVTTYGTYTFSGCTALTSVDLNPSAAKLANYFFAGCTSLKTITLPEKMTEISNNMFDGSGLESIIIPETVTKINQGAFFNTNLKTVNIPAKVSTIGDKAFGDCQQLQYFTVDSANTTFRESEGTLWKEDQLVCYPAGMDPIEEYVITDTMSVAKYAFYGCANINTIVMPENETEIGQYMFAGFAGKEVVLPLALTKINTYAFTEAENLERIVIPEGVTELPMYMFKGAQVKTIVLPSTLTTLGKYVFQNSVIETLVIPESITAIPDYAFDGATIGSLTLPNTIETLGTYVFRNTVMESIVLPDSIKELPNYAFQGSTIKSIKLPVALEKMGTYTFKDCASLESIVFPETLISVGNYSFQGCTALKSVTMNNGLVELGTYMFQGCTSLTQISIPDSVVKVGQYAFNDCTALTKVKLSNSITLLPAFIFKGCTALPSVEIPASVVEIAYECFIGCESMKALYIPETVEKVGRNNFDGWTAEQTVYISNSKDFTTSWNSSWNDRTKTNATIVFDYQGA